MVTTEMINSMTEEDKENIFGVVKTLFKLSDIELSRKEFDESWDNIKREAEEREKPKPVNRKDELIKEAFIRYGFYWKTNFIKSTLGSVDKEEVVLENLFDENTNTLYNLHGIILYQKGKWATIAKEYKPFDKVGVCNLLNRICKADFYSHFNYKSGKHILVSGETARDKELYDIEFIGKEI